MTTPHGVVAYYTHQGTASNAASFLNGNKRVSSADLTFERKGL